MFSAENRDITLYMTPDGHIVYPTLPKVIYVERVAKKSEQAQVLCSRCCTEIPKTAPNSKNDCSGDESDLLVATPIMTNANNEKKFQSFDSQPVMFRIEPTVPTTKVIAKLMDLRRGECQTDNPDSVTDVDPPVVSTKKVSDQRVDSPVVSTKKVSDQRVDPPVVSTQKTRSKESVLPSDKKRSPKASKVRNSRDNLEVTKKKSRKSGTLRSEEDRLMTREERLKQENNLMVFSQDIEAMRSILMDDDDDTVTFGYTAIKTTDADLSDDEFSSENGEVMEFMEITINTAREPTSTGEPTPVFINEVSEEEDLFLEQKPDKRAITATPMSINEILDKEELPTKPVKKSVKSTPMSLNELLEQDETDANTLEEMSDIELSEELLDLMLGSTKDELSEPKEKAVKKKDSNDMIFEGRDGEVVFPVVTGRIREQNKVRQALRLEKLCPGSDDESGNSTESESPQRQKRVSVEETFSEPKSSRQEKTVSEETLTDDKSNRNKKQPTKDTKTVSDKQKRHRRRRRRRDAKKKRDTTSETSGSSETKQTVSSETVGSGKKLSRRQRKNLSRQEKKSERSQKEEESDDESSLVESDSDDEDSVLSESYDSDSNGAESTEEDSYNADDADSSESRRIPAKQKTNIIKKVSADKKPPEKHAAKSVDRSEKSDVSFLSAEKPVTDKPVKKKPVVEQPRKTSTASTESAKQTDPKLNSQKRAPRESAIMRELRLQEANGVNMEDIPLSGPRAPSKTGRHAPSKTNRHAPSKTPKDKVPETATKSTANKPKMKVTTGKKQSDTSSESRSAREAVKKINRQTNRKVERVSE